MANQDGVEGISLALWVVMLLYVVLDPLQRDVSPSEVALLLLGMNLLLHCHLVVDLCDFLGNGGS